MKQHPFISGVGCVTALIFIVGMVAATSVVGGGLFSPGPLSALGSDRPPLKDFTSHVDFEGRCEWCHAPWTGVTADLCEACHTSVAQERASAAGVHGILKSTHDCRLCHVEHNGRDADQSAAAMSSFPHEQTGYSLVKHQTWPDGNGFACRDCHEARAPGYAFALPRCESCHRQVDAAFVDEHAAKYSADCMACHQDLEPFDHHVFPLQGGHAGVRCADCHANADFAAVSATCHACHADPEIHAGMFGTDCSACHAVESWIPARLTHHIFPLDHGGEGEIPCLTCHTETYATYTCTNCHAHDEDEIREKHIEEGILDFADCVECHAEGGSHREGEGGEGD